MVSKETTNDKEIKAKKAKKKENDSSKQEKQATKEGNDLSIQKSKKRKLSSSLEENTPKSEVKKQKKDKSINENHIGKDIKASDKPEKLKNKDKSEKSKSKDDIDNSKPKDSSEKLNKPAKKSSKRPVKWKRNKQKKANQENEDDEDGEKAESKRDQSLSYLKLWSTDRKAWSFKTRLQVWLLKNLFNSAQLPDEYFTTMLSYMEGMHGKCREKTSQQAHDVIKNAGDESESDSDSDNDDDDVTPAEKCRRERARKVIQMLA